jgi:hypothetical protein
MEVELKVIAINTRVRQIKKAGTGIRDSGLVPENLGPGKIPGPNYRDPDRDSGFFSKI